MTHLWWSEVAAKSLLWSTCGGGSEATHSCTVTGDFRLCLAGDDGGIRLLPLPTAAAAAATASGIRLPPPLQAAASATNVLEEEAGEMKKKPFYRRQNNQFHKIGSFISTMELIPLPTSLLKSQLRRKEDQDEQFSRKYRRTPHHANACPIEIIP